MQNSDVVIEYHRPGKSRLAYRERLILDRADVKILLMEAADTALRVEGETVLERGAPIVWFVFPGQGYDVARFHLADRMFTGWYTNLCTPVVFGERQWSMTDLFLDLWLPPTGQPQWLDEDEFEAAAAKGVLTESLVFAARTERTRIDSLLARRAWPPRICKETDLKSLLSRSPLP
jgi:predicted RNA-binding protein associated with RNAse of E/G family